MKASRSQQCQQGVLSPELTSATRLGLNETKQMHTFVHEQIAGESYEGDWSSKSGKAVQERLEELSAV